MAILQHLQQGPGGGEGGREGGTVGEEEEEEEEEVDAHGVCGASSSSLYLPDL